MTKMRLSGEAKMGFGWLTGLVVVSVFCMSMAWGQGADDIDNPQPPVDQAGAAPQPALQAPPPMMAPPIQNPPPQMAPPIQNLPAGVQANPPAAAPAQNPAPAPAPVQAPPVVNPPAGPVGGAPAGAAAPAAEGEGGTGLDKVIKRIVVNNTNVRDFLAFLAKESNLNFVPSAKVQGTVTVQLSGVSVRQVLDQVLPLYDWVWEKQGDVVLIKHKSEVAATPTAWIKKAFTIQYAPIDQIQKAIVAYRTPTAPNIIADPATKQIIVEDTADAVTKMGELIDRLDVPTETRVFKIRYADVNDVLRQIQPLTSGAKEGVQVDARTNTLIITDLPENLDKIAKLIAQLDTKTTMRVYSVNFADPKDVIKMVKPLLTKEGFMEYDERSSQLLVEDIPSRMDKIEQIIKSVDKPTKEVYIEGEIVELDIGDSSNYGINWSAGSSVNINPASGTSDLSILDPVGTLNGGSFSLAYLEPKNFRVTLNALQKKNKANILASPRLLVKNDEDAKMQVGSEEPYSVETTLNEINAGNVFTQRSKDVGIILDVKPHINDAGYVEMEIALTNSSAQEVALSGNLTGLRVLKTEADTVVTVKSGRTVVLGGLIETTVSKDHNGIPVLSQIPIVGLAFGNHDKTYSKRKLLMFLTPYMVDIDEPYRYSQLESRNKKGISDLSGEETPFVTPWESIKNLEQENEKGKSKVAPAGAAAPESAAAPAAVESALPPVGGGEASAAVPPLGEEEAGAPAMKGSVSTTTTENIEPLSSGTPAPSKAMRRQAARASREKAACPPSAVVVEPQAISSKEIAPLLEK